MIADAIKETQYHLNFNNYLELSISICVKTTTSIVYVSQMFIPEVRTVRKELKLS